MSPPPETVNRGSLEGAEEAGGEWSDVQIQPSCEAEVWRGGGRGPGGGME